MKTCASCRYSLGVDEVTLHCALRGLQVRFHFQCERYEYEPGSLG